MGDNELLTQDQASERVKDAMPSGLAYLAEVVALVDIATADRLVRAQVDCRAGGRWWGVVRKAEGYTVGSPVVVYLQDAVVPPVPEFEFLAKYHYRVRMQKLRGCPSEVLIMPAGVTRPDTPIGTDVTVLTGVTKFEKKLPATMLGGAKARNWPAILPKTDELNFQKARHLVDEMKDGPVVVTEKVDGSSMTVYRRGDHFGVCSRNLEIERPADPQANIFWRVALGMGLDRTLRDGCAVQGELAGPGIQKNPLGLLAVTMFAFQIYRFVPDNASPTPSSVDTYLPYAEFVKMCDDELQIPRVRTLRVGPLESWTDEALQALAESYTYPNGGPVEGIVIRPLNYEMRVLGERVSVKVLNLAYQG